MPKTKNLSLKDSSEEDSTELSSENVVPFLKPDYRDSDGNWLSKLEVGTVFLARPKNDYQTIDLVEYLLRDKTKEAVRLQINLQAQQILTWVTPNRFCSKMELVEVLRVANEIIDES